jgi:hypothetical protein
MDARRDETGAAWLGAVHDSEFRPKAAAQKKGRPNWPPCVGAMNQ